VSSPFCEIIQANASHYAELLRTHGDTPAAAQWSDQDTQDRRLSILCEIGDLSTSRVLDFGCGTGRLFTLLRARGFSGTYVGYDVAPTVVEAAREKHPGAVFECRDILAQGVEEDFDYVLLSGVFNNRYSASRRYVEQVLTTLSGHCHKGLAFNALSTFVDYFDRDLTYLDPLEMFSFCKSRLSPAAMLRHDYFLKDGTVPYEYTIYVYPNNLKCRVNRPVSDGA
jgi:SAM-dependent methyltransferase